MAVNSQTMAHNFFYQTESTRGNYARLTVSFNADTFYSYDTAIGQKTTDIHGARVLLVSDDNFSNTTAKHLNHLRAACPYECIHVPQRYGSGFMDVDTSINLLLRRLEGYTAHSLRLKPNRMQFTEYYQSLETLKARFKPDLQIPEELTELYNIAHNPEELKRIKAEERKKAAEELKQLKAETKDFLSKNTFSEACAFAYKYSSFSENERKFKNALKRVLSGQGAYFVVWFEGDSLKTSQNVTVDKVEAIAVMRLYKAGKLFRGAKIDSLYTVLEVNREYVKVGCHKISRENIDKLLEEVKNEKTAAA